MATYNYEVKQKLGTLGKRGINTIELRLVSWDGKDPAYDIRTWYTDSKGTEKCTVGVTMKKEHLKQLLDIIKNIDFT